MSASRSRGIGAIAVALVLAVTASFAIGIGVNTAWARRTLLDTNGFLEHVSRPLLADPAAKDALARELTNQTLGNIDLGAGLTEMVPFYLRVVADQLANQLGDQLEATIKEQLEPAIRQQLDSDLVTRTWDEASREVQSQLIDELSSGTRASTINVDLHEVLVRAIHEVGVKVKQDHSALPLVTEVFDGIGTVLPSSVGVVPIDVSHVQGPARFAVAHAAGIEVAAFLIGFGALALALVVSRRRGLTVLVFGAGLVVMALLGYALFAFGFDNAGATVAAQSGTRISADMQQIVDIQANLILASYRPWAGALALAGIVLAIIGALWVAIARGSEPNSPSSPGTPVYAADAPTPVMASGWELPSSPPVR